MGAPKFTPELGKAIAELVRQGVPVGTAARAKRVGKATVYDWRARGQKGEQPYANFLEELETAMGEVEIEITENVIKAAAEDWKAGAFWLKCRNPEVYGDEIKITQQVQRGVEESFDAMRPHMSDGAYLEMLHAYAKVMGVEGLADRPAERSAEKPGEH